MWRNRFSDRIRLATLWLLAVLPAFGQGTSSQVAYIQVAAPQTFIVSGRTLELQATASTVLGATIADFRPQWRSSNPAVADVDDNGRVRGLLPGVAGLEAHAPGAVGRITVRVYPLRIEVLPTRAQLEIGQRVTVAARALDADGRPISGVRFLWFAGLSGVASVESDGSVTARGEGYTTISALLDVPSPEFHASGQATVVVRRRPPYRITSLISTDFETRPVTLSRIGEVSYDGQNRYAFIGTLSNGSQALMLYVNGNLRTLLIEGEYLEAAGGIVQHILSVAINSRGDLLALIDFHTAPRTLVLFREGQPTVIPLAFGEREGTCCYCCLSIGTRALGENGDIAFTVWNGRASELYVLRPSGRLDAIVAGGQSLPDFGPANWLSLPSVSVRGSVLFMAWGPQQSGAFQWDGRQVRRLYATNEPLLGRTVRWFDAPLETPSGDIYARVSGDNFNIIARLSRGAWEQVVPASPAGGSPNIWGIHRLLDAQDNAVVFMADSDQGRGLFTTTGDRAQLLTRFGTATEANQWWDIRQAFRRPQGDVVVVGSQGSILSKIAILTGVSPASLLESGQVLDRGAPTSLLWSALGNGVNSRSPVFQTGGGLLARVGRNSLEPVVSPGDVLDGNRRVSYIEGHAPSRNGDIAFTAQTTDGLSLYLFRNARTTLVVSTGMRFRTADQQEVTIHWLYGPLAVNDRGQIAVRANFDRFEGLLFFPGGGSAPTVVMTRGAPAPGGGTYNWPHEVALDESGRVVFVTDLPDGSSALFLWENGQTRRISRRGDAAPGGFRITGIGQLQAAGNRFYALLSSEQGPEQIVGYDGASWRAVVSRGERTGFGPVLQWFHFNRFVANSSGDVAYMPGVPGEIVLAVRKADGRDVVVARPTDRSADGDWLAGFFFDLTFSDSGEIFFSIPTVSPAGERITLFRATPQ